MLRLRPLCLALGAFSALALLTSVPAARAALVATGGTYQVSGTNFPVNFGPTNVTFDNTVHSLAGGQLNLQAQTTAASPTSEWVQFNFSTANGASIAGNVNGFWDFKISNIPYSQPVNFKALFYQWTINGQAIANVQNWLGGVVYNDGVNPPGTNPINASQGPGFGGVATTVTPPFDPSLFMNPYNLISTSAVGGVDPNQVNGFRIAMLVEQANVVPEPGSCLVWSVLGMGAACLVRRRRNKQRAAETAPA